MTTPEEARSAFELAVDGLLMWDAGAEVGLPEPVAAASAVSDAYEPAFNRAAAAAGTMAGEIAKLHELDDSQIDLLSRIMDSTVSALIADTGVLVAGAVRADIGSRAVLRVEISSIGPAAACGLILT